MFTLLVSWLLVACVPGLLMLAALGLGRLEKELAHDTVTATDVAEFLDRPRPWMCTPWPVKACPRRWNTCIAARPSNSATLRRPAPPAGIAPSRCWQADLNEPGAAGSPMRIHAHSGANPQFPATRHVNRV